MYDVRFMYDWVYVRCTRPLYFYSFVHPSYIVHFSFVHQRSLVIRVVRGGFEGPEVGTKGRLGSGGAELGLEGSLVGSHLRGVLQASGDSRADSREAQTGLQFGGLDGRGTGDGRQVAQIDARAVLTGGGGYAVGSQHHLLVSRMGRLLVDLGQCTADHFKHRCILGNSHSLSAIGRID